MLVLDNEGVLHRDREHQSAFFISMPICARFLVIIRSGSLDVPALVDGFRRFFNLLVSQQQFDRRCKPVSEP